MGGGVGEVLSRGLIYIGEKLKGSGVEWNLMPMIGHFLGRIHPFVGGGGG